MHYLLEQWIGGVITGNEGISLATPPNPRGILATLLAQASSSVLVAVAKANAAARARALAELADSLGE